MERVAYAHIEFRDDGKPIIAGTRTKVKEVVLDHIADGWDADEIHRQYPYLSLGQIHSALAYYYDHKDEMDREIQEDVREFDELRAKAGESPTRKKLRAMGLRP